MRLTRMPPSDSPRWDSALSEIRSQMSGPMTSRELKQLAILTRCGSATNALVVGEMRGIWWWDRAGRRWVPGVD